MKWITREHPRVDRVACPWLVARFIDTDAEFVYAPAVVHDALYAYCKDKVAR